MKNKSLIMFFALFLFTSMSFGQSSDFGEKISIGVKVGANLSNVYDTQGDEFDANAKLGLAVGGFLQIPIGTFLGFHPEVLFSQKGYQGSGSILGSDYNYVRTTNYIDVPLLVAFKVSPAFTFLLGPQYSYLVSQKYYLHTALGDINQEEQFENENLLKNTFCVTSGFDLNVNNIVIGARAGWDVLSNKGDGTSSTPRYKNMWYQATVGYRF